MDGVQFTDDDDFESNINVKIISRAKKKPRKTKLMKTRSKRTFTSKSRNVTSWNAPKSTKNISRKATFKKKTTSPAPLARSRSKTNKGKKKSMGDGILLSRHGGAESSDCSDVSGSTEGFD